MKIDIQYLPDDGIEQQYRMEARQFGVLNDLVDRGECQFTDPIGIALKIIPQREVIKVRGSLDFTVKLACSRCLEPFKTRVHTKFTLRFSRIIPSDTTPSPEEVELTAEQIGLNYFEGEQIDLKEPVQEQIVLAIPYKPLCREACKGICQHCGADLNTASCDCGAKVINSPFAVLKGRSWPAKK